MRTTIRLNDSLFRQVKQLAAKSGRSFTALVEEALRDTLARAGKRPGGGRIKLKTSRGAFRPGIDLNRLAELRDLMDGVDAHS